MARGVNMVVLVGNLGNDPETRYSQSGAAITTISLATSESWKDKNGEQQERTEWHRVKFFGRLAEIAGEYLKKGRQVYIQGSLRTEKYTDKNGVEKFSTDVIASEMQMLGGEGGGAGAGGGGGGGGRERQGSSGSGGGARGYGRSGGGGGGGAGGMGYGNGGGVADHGSRTGNAPMDDTEIDDIPFLRSPSTTLF